MGTPKIADCSARRTYSLLSHSLPGGVDPPSATTSRSCLPYSGFECRSDVKIYNSKTGEYVLKTPVIPNALFFTQSIADTVNYLTTLYKKCSGSIQKGKICVHDTDKKIAITLVIVNDSMDVLTAYPFRVEDIPTAGCGAKCNYP